MTIRIGANPIGWSNDDMLELGGETPLEQCLSEAKAIGFEGMELGNKFPRTSPALRPILAQHGLALVSGWYSTYLLERDVDAELAASLAHRTLLKEMGCRVLIVAECTRTVHGDMARPLSTRPVMTDADWLLFAPRMSEFAERVADDGLDIVYHHHMGTVVQTGAEIDRLMADTSRHVGLLLDTGHATWGGADPADLARRYRARVGHVHTKDVRAAVAVQSAREDWSFLRSVVEGVYTVPGDGSIDFAAVLRELAGYHGWVVIEAEQDPKKAPPARYAKLGYDHLVGVLTSIGQQPHAGRSTT